MEAGLVDVRFFDPVGDEVCIPWQDACAEVEFERCPAVRPFPVRRGKRVAPGWWWSSTTGRFVHYGTGAMRRHVMLLDQNPRVAGMSCRPVQLLWPQGDQAGVHVPQLMVRLADGQGVLADCTSGAGLSQKQRAVAAVLDQVCAEVGWQYWVLGPVAAVYRANITWLSGYRHQRYRGGAELAAGLRTAFAERRPLVEGVSGLGDPLTVMPALFHALWSGSLATDLQAPLHERMEIWAETAS